MKKSLITILTIIMFSLFSSQAFACSNVSSTMSTIDYVYYDSNDKTYYAVTVEDALQGRWVLNIESLKDSDTNTLDELNKAYKGQQILINYIGNLTNDEEIEIVSAELIQQ